MPVFNKKEQTALSFDKSTCWAREGGPARVMVTGWSVLERSREPAVEVRVVPAAPPFARLRVQRASVRRTGKIQHLGRPNRPPAPVDPSIGDGWWVD